MPVNHYSQTSYRCAFYSDFSAQKNDNVVDVACHTGLTCSTNTELSITVGLTNSRSYANREMCVA